MSNNPTNWPPSNDGSFQQSTTNAPPDDQGWNGNNSWSKMQSQQQIKDHNINNMNDINKMMSNVQIGQQGEGGWTKQQDAKDPQFNWNNKTSQELSSTTPSWGPNAVPQQGWGPQPPQQVSGGADNGTNAWGSSEQQAQKWNHSNNQQSPQTSTPQSSSENPAVPTSNSDSQNKLTAVVAPNNQNITENPNTSAAPTQTTNSDDLKPAPQQPNEAAVESKPDIQQKTDAKEKIDPVVRLVNMHEGWGITPVNQQTKWDTSQSCIIRPGSQNSAAYPPNPNGTDGWGRNSGQMQNSGWNDSRRMSNNSGWHGNAQGNSWNSSNNHGPGGYGNNQQWGNDHRGGDNWNSGSNQWNPNNQGMNNRWDGPPMGMHGGARSGYNSMNNRNYGSNMGNQWNNPTTDNYSRNDMRSRPIDNGTSQWGQPPDYNDNQKWGGGQMNRGMGFGGHNMNHNKWDSQSQMGGLNQHKQGNDWNDNNNWNKNRQQDLWKGNSPWNNKSIQQPNNWNGPNNYHDNSTWGSHNQQKYGGPGNRNMPEYGMMGNNASMNRHQSIGNQMVHPNQLMEQAVKAGMPHALFQGNWQNNERFITNLRNWINLAQEQQNTKSRLVQGPLDQMMIRQLTERIKEIDESMENAKIQLMQSAGISLPNFMPKNQGMQPPVRTQSNFSAMGGAGGWGGNPPQMKDEMSRLKQQFPDPSKPNEGAANAELLKEDQASLNPASPITLDGVSVPEFLPGKMWSGLTTQIDPDNDPNITPALMKQMDSKGAQQQEQVGNDPQ